MSPVVWIVVGGLAGGFLVWRLLVPSLDKVVDQSAASKEIQPIVEAISKKSAASQPTAFNHAIRRLWDNYNRPLAVDLVKVLAEGHGATAIAQYWLKQVLDVEPGMAKKSFPKEFLDTYYQPEVAAKCGHVG